MIITNTWLKELKALNSYFKAPTTIFFMVTIVTPPIRPWASFFLQKSPRLIQNHKETLETYLLPPQSICLSVYLYKHILELNWIVKETYLSFIYSQEFNQALNSFKFILFLYNSCESWWVIRIDILVLLFSVFKKMGSEILF